MIVICKQTHAMHFVYYQSHGDVMMRLWLCFALLMLMPIPLVGCIFFWIYNSCKLLFSKVSSNAMIVQKFIKLSKFINLLWNNVHSTNLANFDFLDHRLFAIRKVIGIINHPMLRVYYLPSEELTFTLKFRESPLNKTYGNWA